MGAREVVGAFGGDGDLLVEGEPVAVGFAEPGGGEAVGGGGDEVKAV